MQPAHQMQAHYAACNAVKYTTPWVSLDADRNAEVD